MLGVNGDSEGLRKPFLAFLELLLLKSALVTLPRIHEVVVETVHNLVFRLDDSRRALLIRRLFTVLLLGIKGGLGSLGLFFLLLLLGHLLLVRLHLTHDVFLQLRLLLVHIHVVQQLVAHLFLDSHQLGLATMALAVDVLENFVVGAELLLVLCEDAVDAIQGRVSDKLLELWHVAEIGHVSVEHHIVSHANIALKVLIMLAFADTVRQTPRCTFLAVWTGHLLALRLVYLLVPADVDKGLLVEELLLEVADHFLG